MVVAGPLSIPLIGQSTPWTTNSNGTIYYNGGNVGIGTTAPETELHLFDPSGASNFLVDVPNQSTYNALVSLRRQSTAIWNVGLDSSDLQFKIATGSGYDNLRTGAILTISPTGSVGIGTTAPQHLLQVAGTIGAEEVIVSSTGADFVFDPGYRLVPLNEVADYVKENHHLPDIPSAKEVAEKGVGLGEMQAKLLAKIEELTLHMIEAEKKNARLGEEVGQIREENRRMRDRIDGGVDGVPR